jgi:hypothetical protein
VVLKKKKITVNDAAKAKKWSRSSQPLRSSLRLREDENMFKDKSTEHEAALLSPIKGTDWLANTVCHISSSAPFLTVVFCSMWSGLSLLQR